MWLLGGASRLLPLAQDGVDWLPYLLARELPIASWVQSSGGSRSANPAAVAATRVYGDPGCLVTRPAGEERADLGGKCRHKVPRRAVVRAGHHPRRPCPHRRA